MSPAPTLAQQEAHARATQLLTDHGINPDTVLARDITEVGYLTFTYDDNGKRLFDVHGDDLTYRVEVNDWPKGFPVDQLLADVREWQGAEL